MPMVTTETTRIVDTTSALIYVGAQLATGHTIDDLREKCTAALERDGRAPHTVQAVANVRHALGLIEESSTGSLIVPAQRTVYPLYS